MKDIGAALAAGLWAPLRRWRLVLVLWLGRLLPILIFFGLPVFGQLDARVSHHPDANQLLDPGADTTGFTFEWLSDTVRNDVAGAPEKVFWLILVGWLLVTLLAGGIVARLIHGRSGGFLENCGRYAGRFLRLALVAAVCFYALDFVVNALLAEAHAKASYLYHTQAYERGKVVVRGALFLTVLQVLGAIHSYARIEIVAHERRSALLSFLRGLATLILRLPKLLVIEVAMLFASGAAVLVAWLLRSANPLTADASWLPVGGVVLFTAFASYLRTGIELGTLEARCRLLAPSRDETVHAPVGGDDEGLPLAVQSP
jgi:hypothetical protein